LKKDALDAVGNLRTLIDSGKIPEVKKKKARIRPMSFSDIALLLKEIWDDRLLKNDLRKATHRGYLEFLSSLENVYGDLLISEISKTDISAFQVDEFQRSSAICSNRKLFVLKQVFKHAFEIGAINYNPATEVQYLSEKDHERCRFLMPEEIKKLVSAAKQTKAKYYLPVIVYLGVEHGASKQEILDLTWEDINFDFGNTGMINLFRTKTGRKRADHIMPMTRQSLLEWRIHLIKMKKRVGLDDKIEGLVFIRADGTPLGNFNRAWWKARKLAGFDNLHFHDLRHTFCSNLMFSEADIKGVKDMIGHYDLSSTDRYTHLAFARRKILQDRLSAHYGFQE
jgi:site-specific recombinase XerD